MDKGRTKMLADISKDARTFLLDFHATYPGCTSKTFGDCQTATGHSSYDLLVQGTPRGARVLDLGCGDGFLLSHFTHRGHSAKNLTGIDISPHELERARARPQLEHSWLHQGCATALPLGNSSIDVVVSHLSLMLMRPIERVLDEVARVLASGGQLRGIMGGGPAETPAANGVDIFLECIKDLSSHHYRSVPQLSDCRLRRENGLRDIFEEHPQFANFDMKYHHVKQAVSADDAWALMSLLYESKCIPSARRAHVEHHFRQRCVHEFCDNSVQLIWAIQELSVVRI